MPTSPRQSVRASASALRAPEGPILMTGATGFVGANLARRLLSYGGDVHVLVRPEARWWRLADVRKHLTVHVVDLLDFERLCEVVKRVRPLTIYHLATHGAYPSQTDADRVIRTNFLGTWNLLRACAPVPYRLFINTGSSSEYGAKTQAMRETDLPEPNSDYAVAKASQTLLCQHAARAEQRPIQTFRLFSAYGPYEEPTRLVPTVVSRCLDGAPLEMTHPETARDFIYVDDVVDAYLQVGPLSRCVGEVFNIGTGVQSTLRDVVAGVQAAAGSSVPVRWGELPDRAWDTTTWVADVTKVRRLLGWSASVRLEDGLRRTVAWSRDVGASLARGAVPTAARRAARPARVRPVAAA